MAKQTQNGKAFEYACLESISTRYKDHVSVVLEEDAAYNTAKNAYLNLDDHKNVLSRGAEKGVEIIEHLEANLMQFDDSDELTLSIQSDSKGQNGDVRDVIVNKSSSWEIGISAKHNHEAVKHSRLSPTIDFGDKWLGYKCSQNYFDEINKVFDNLNKHKGKKWNDIDIDKANNVYRPLLIAFKSELMKLYHIHGSTIPSKLVKYLLGEHDFYKLILDVDKEIIKVNAYNLDGSLNKKTRTRKSDFKLPKLHLPDRIFHLDFMLNDGIESDNTLELICNNGWQFSFRIHNASSRIENSMKFDIKLIGVPTDIQSFIGII